MGEDVIETLEVVPRKWTVIQTVRERFSCPACESISQAPPIELPSEGGSNCLEANPTGTHSQDRSPDRPHHSKALNSPVSSIAKAAGSAMAAMRKDSLNMLIDRRVLKSHSADTESRLLSATGV